MAAPFSRPPPPRWRFSTHTRTHPPTCGFRRTRARTAASALCTSAGDVRLTDLCARFSANQCRHGGLGGRGVWRRQLRLRRGRRNLVSPRASTVAAINWPPLPLSLRRRLRRGRPLYPGCHAPSSLCLCALCAFWRVFNHTPDTAPPPRWPLKRESERERTYIGSDAIHTRVYIMAWLLSVQQRWRCVRAVCVSLSRVWPSAHQLLSSYTSVTSSVRLP